MPEMTWDDFRRDYLTAAGWRYHDVASYRHRVTGNFFHPHDGAQDPETGQVRPTWKLYAAAGEAPDPYMTHRERRASFGEANRG